MQDFYQKSCIIASKSVRFKRTYTINNYLKNRLLHRKVSDIILTAKSYEEFGNSIAMESLSLSEGRTLALFFCTKRLEIIFLSSFFVSSPHKTN